MPKTLDQPAAPPPQADRPASSYQRAPGSGATSARTAPAAPRLVRDPAAQRKQQTNTPTPWERDHYEQEKGQRRRNRSTRYP